MGFAINGMVEKPKRGTAPSNLYINGRYILQPEIFSYLETQERGTGNEIQLTDAMLKLMNDQPFYGSHFKGGRLIAARRKDLSKPIWRSRFGGRT